MAAGEADEYECTQYINAKLVNNSNVTVDPTSCTVEETVNLTASERRLALVVYMVSSHLLYCKR